MDEWGDHKLGTLGLHAGFVFIVLMLSSLRAMPRDANSHHSYPSHS